MNVMSVLSMIVKRRPCWYQSLNRPRLALFKPMLPLLLGIRSVEQQLTVMPLVSMMLFMAVMYVVSAMT
jgi:hypothetical protein